FGCHLNYDDEAGSCMAEAIALFGLIVTVSVGLGVAAQGEEAAAWTPLIIYLAIASVTIFGFVGILVAKPANGQSDVHDFNHGSIISTRWFMVWSVAIVFATSFLYRFEMIPGQSTKIELPVATVADHEFQDKNRGLVLFVNISTD